jgi:hypothetical protein
VASALTPATVVALWSAEADNRPRGGGGCAQARLEQGKRRGKGAAAMGMACFYSGTMGGRGGGVPAQAQPCRSKGGRGIGRRQRTADNGLRPVGAGGVGWCHAVDANRGGKHGSDRWAL